jgi:hypothetical protein
MDAKHLRTELKDVNSSLVRIQRSYSELVKCKEKMSSYLCEPTTSGLFETREKLKLKMEALMAGHLDLLHQLEHKKDSLTKELGEITAQLQAVKQLEKGISNYMLAAHP